MPGLALVLLIGLIGGISVGVQSPIAGAMGQKVGGTASSAIIHLSGFIFSVILLVIRGGENIQEWTGLPWYMLGAGIFGLILYQTINVTLPRLGATTMLVLIIIGQLLTGVVLDSFGLLGVALRPIDLTRIIGVVVLIIGGYLVVK
ncbi:MAG: DMT family transporter [Anaerolineaceae bacterium]|nr:DMT family transporter [Anaerolineaceae bacterium]